MSYLKLCQIADISTVAPVPPRQNPTTGANYLEDVNGVISVNVTPLSFPLLVNCEVLDWGTQENLTARGPLAAPYLSVNITIPDNSVSIRQAAFNQLVVSYPSLII